MQSRVYIGNFSAEGNVFVGNFHDFPFAHILASYLGAKPCRPPCRWPIAEASVALTCNALSWSFCLETFKAAGQSVPGN